MSDSDIWNYAFANNFIILTRDSDYFHRMMQAKQYPKVIYFKLQDAGIRELHNYFSLYWKEIQELIAVHKMIIALPATLEIF